MAYSTKYAPSSVVPYNGAVYHKTAWTGLSVINNPTVPVGLYTNPAATISVAAGAGATYGQILRCTGYGFAIPSGATIDSIQALVTFGSDLAASGEYGYCEDYDDAANGYPGAWFVKAGSIVSPRYVVGSDSTPATCFPATVGAWIPAGAMTPVDVNSSDFGIDCALYVQSWAGHGANTLKLFAVAISIDYTVPGGYAHKVNGVLPANIASINGIPTANIAKFKGV